MRLWSFEELRFFEEANKAMHLFRKTNLLEKSKSDNSGGPGEVILLLMPSRRRLVSSGQKKNPSLLFDGPTEDGINKTKPDQQY